MISLTVPCSLAISDSAINAIAFSRFIHAHSPKVAHVNSLATKPGKVYYRFPTAELIDKVECCGNKNPRKRVVILSPEYRV
ncbi:hypothetical protein [Coleofasciculus sp. E2-BRE-01]|uniref:hypothetical protein n=1 Tax=Coleofasciculus sp. E2-BRE-01 TaxID=3069524 RepID=UPI0032F25132